MSGAWLLEVVVPGPPVGAARPRVTRGGTHTYMPPASRAWELRCRALAAAAWTGPPLDQGVEVEVVQVQPRPQRLRRRQDPLERMWAPTGKPDLDNVAKLAMDGLVKAGVLLDDTRVVRLVAMKLHAAMDEEPCTEVRVRPAA